MLQRRPNATPVPGPYAEAVARLSAIHRSLRLAESHGGGPASDSTGEADSSAGAIAEAAIVGLDALIAVGSDAAVAPAEASREMVDRIRRELAEISGIAFS